MASVEEEFIQAAQAGRASREVAACAETIGLAFTSVTEVAKGLGDLLMHETSAPGLLQDSGTGSKLDVAERRLAGSTPIVDALGAAVSLDSSDGMEVLERAGFTKRNVDERDVLASSVMGRGQGGVLNELLTPAEEPANGVQSAWGSAMRAATEAESSLKQPATQGQLQESPQVVASRSSRLAFGVPGDPAADVPGFPARRGRGGKAMQQIVDGILELVEVHTAASGRAAYANGYLPTR